MFTIGVPDRIASRSGARARPVVDDGRRRRLRGHDLADLGQQRLGGGRAGHVHRASAASAHSMAAAVRAAERARQARQQRRHSGAAHAAPHGVSGSGRNPPSGPSSGTRQAVIERQLAGEPARAAAAVGQAGVRSDRRQARHALLARGVARGVAGVARQSASVVHLYGLVSVSSRTEHPAPPPANTPTIARATAKNTPVCCMRAREYATAPARSCFDRVTLTSQTPAAS